MTEHVIILEDLQSLGELMDKVDASPDKAQLSTMSITSSKFSLPASGSATIFEDLPNLEHLHINNNCIEILISGAFYNLENLRYLELKNNGIEKIEDGAFSELPSLFSLDISNNDIEKIENGAFEGLDRLGNLILNSNSIVSLEKEVFRNLRFLFNLELAHNKIRELDEELFEDLENLGHLILKNNKLQNLPAKVFRPLRRLRHLDVSYNKVIDLPQNLLCEFAMDVVNFSFNKIMEIHESALFGLKLFTGILNLEHNNLTVLKSKTLEVISRKVVLSNNQMKFIESGAFCGCTCEELYLNGNSLTQVSPEALKGLQVSHRLCLSDNKIERLPAAFTNCSELHRLDLDGNNLEELPGAPFEGLGNLILLSLNNNSIKTLVDDTFSGLPNLVVLHLQNNQLEELNENCFAELPKLTSLILHSNKLSAIPPQLLSRNTELDELDLMNNEFTDLPPHTIYSNLTNLSKINFSHNKIGKLPASSFADESDSKVLHAISLKSNQISEIESGAFNGIEYVKYLILGSNGISTVPINTFIGLRSVYKLELDNNSIDSTDSLAELPRTTILSLTGNPLEGEDLTAQGLTLDQIDVISFENHSYKRDDGVWRLSDHRIEELEERT